jgi:hypothetical protein
MSITIIIRRVNIKDLGLVLGFAGCFVGFAYQGKDIVVVRFILEYSSLMDFGH